MTRVVLVLIYDIPIVLKFHTFEMDDFDLLIGYPLEKEFEEGSSSGNLQIHMGKGIDVSIPIS